MVGSNKGRHFVSQCGAQMGFDPALQRFGVSGFGFENHVAAGDESLDVCKSQIFKQQAQVIHLDDVAADIDGAKEGDIFWHKLSSPTRCSTLPFTKTVAELVRGNDEKDFPGRVAVLIHAKVPFRFTQTIGFQFRKGGFGIINLKETPFLRRVAAIFSQPDLNLISTKNSRPKGRFLSRDKLKAHDRFVEWEGRFDVLDRSEE